MIVRLFCPKCTLEATKAFKTKTNIELAVPVSRLSDSGEYEIQCSVGHTGTVILNNIKFELLFEMGLNAIIDGYPREAVSSFASALERFYEFYWRVVMHHFDMPKDQVERAWKPLSKFSERQIGAFSSAVLQLTKTAPTLLNTNKQVPFRNNVIHNGYVPTEEEAITFGDAIKELIECHLNKLRQLSADSLIQTYQELSPKSRVENLEENEDENKVIGIINILTAIDVQNPPKKKADTRHGGVKNQFQRILNDRQPIDMQLLSKEEMKKRFPGKGFPMNT